MTQTTEQKCCERCSIIHERFLGVMCDVCLCPCHQVSQEKINYSRGSSGGAVESGQIGNAGSAGGMWGNSGIVRNPDGSWYVKEFTQSQEKPITHEELFSHRNKKCKCFQTPKEEDWIKEFMEKYEWCSSVPSKRLAAIDVLIPFIQLLLDSQCKRLILEIEKTRIDKEINDNATKNSRATTEDKYKNEIFIRGYEFATEHILSLLQKHNE